MWLQICNVKSFGEGPVVYIHPMELDFGSIYVLQDSSRVLNLCNQAFIPARFRAYMVSRGASVVKCGSAASYSASVPEVSNQPLRTSLERLPVTSVYSPLLPNPKPLYYSLVLHQETQCKSTITYMDHTPRGQDSLKTSEAA